MIGWHWEQFLLRSINTFTPERQFPVGEGPVVFIDHRVLDHNTPFADTGFAPGKPISKTILLQVDVPVLTNALPT